jgi:hypothetical protein
MLQDDWNLIFLLAENIWCLFVQTQALIETHSIEAMPWVLSELNV